MKNKNENIRIKKIKKIMKVSKLRKLFEHSENLYFAKTKIILNVERGVKLRTNKRTNEQRFSEQLKIIRGTVAKL